MRRLDSVSFPLWCESDSEFFVYDLIQYVVLGVTFTDGIPWCFDLYSQSTMTSLSVTPSALKFFLTARAS